MDAPGCRLQLCIRSHAISRSSLVTFKVCFNVLFSSAGVDTESNLCAIDLASFNFGTEWFNSLSCNLSDWISEFISLIWELFKDNWISKSFKFDNWVKLSSWANILPFLTYPPDLKSLEILKTSPNIGNFKFACLDDETEPNAIFSGL